MAVFKYKNKEDAIMHIETKIMMIELPDLGIDQKNEFINDVKELCKLNDIDYEEYKHQNELNTEIKLLK
jgi:hypothetical protein